MRNLNKGRDSDIETVVSWITVHSLHLVTVQTWTLPNCFLGLSLFTLLFFMCGFSCCQYIVLDVIPLFLCEMS
jgi:hypothetical protein